MDTGSPMWEALKPLSICSILMILQGCGTGPVLQHTNADLIHLGSIGADSVSCGHDLSTYADQAQLTCQKNGYKAAKIRHRQNSKIETCLNKIVEATFKCEEASSF
jgi:hypothetical protein